MCGIAYKRKVEFKDYFDIAHLRGTDGIGILGVGGSVWKGYATTLNDFTTRNIGRVVGGTFEFTDKSNSDQSWKLEGNVSWGDIYQSILDTVLKQRNKNEYALIHHRKTSIGSDSIDNVHPFPINNGRYFLLQNGSSNAIHDWGIIHFLSEVKTHSDTYYLSKFIEEKGCNSLNDIAELLGKLIRSGVNLGVICVVDTSNDTILLLSDGCRSLYIDMDVAETKVDSFSSLTDKGDDEYFFKGFMLLDFEGNILHLKYEYINKFTTKTKYPITTTYSNATGIPYASEEDITELDRYYSNKKKEDENLTIFQTLGESVNWKDGAEADDTIDWIDPVLIVDSTDLQNYMTDFWETESDLAQRKNTGFGQGGVWDTLVSKLCTTANLISMEMHALVEDFYDTYQTQDIEYLWEYIEGERMNLMETVLEYEENFEYDE